MENIQPTKIEQITLGGLRTLDEILESPEIKAITKFISKKEFKKFDRNGFIPCYLLNTKKGYKIKEVKDWVINQLTTKYDGMKIMSSFNVYKSTLKQAIMIPKELSNHNDDLYEFNSIPSCVYFLIDAIEIVYVGQSTNLSLRIHTHQSNKEFNKVIYMPIEEGRLNEVERFFIETLEPKYNKEDFKIRKRYRYKGLGYKFINKVLYRENSNGQLDKIL